MEKKKRRAGNCVQKGRFHGKSWKKGVKAVKTAVFRSFKKSCFLSGLLCRKCSVYILLLVPPNFPYRVCKYSSQNSTFSRFSDSPGPVTGSVCWSSSYSPSISFSFFWSNGSLWLAMSFRQLLQNRHGWWLLCCWKQISHSNCGCAAVWGGFNSLLAIVWQKGKKMK